MTDSNLSHSALLEQFFTQHNGQTFTLTVQAVSIPVNATVKPQNRQRQMLDDPFSIFSPMWRTPPI